MKAEELPLFELYTRLQEAGLPLGLNEYAQAVKALQAGFGLPDATALSRLCRALWVKNEEEAYLFNHHFAEVMGTRSLSYADLAKASNQTAAFQREAAFTQTLTAQTTRNGLMGIAAALFLFLTLFPITLTVERLFLNRSGDIPQNPSPIETEAIPAQPDPPALNEVPASEGFQIPVARLSSLAGIMLLSTGSAWLLIRQLMVPKDILPTEHGGGVTAQATIARTNVTAAGDDVFPLVEAIQRASESKAEAPNVKVLGQDEYFPLTRRQMKQGWRYLRRSGREGPKTELDVDGTIDEIGRQGMFVQPAMRAPRSNRTDLIFLLDQDGSMVPFEQLSTRLANTARRSGRLGQSGVYYFHNCPKNYLYRDPLMQEPIPFRRFLAERLSSKSMVMIVSDAGAARGGYNPNRIQKTKAFLTRLNQCVRYQVWLNPVPQNYWENTTAAEIARVITMFEVKKDGFKGAINRLRGYWKYST